MNTHRFLIRRFITKSTPLFITTLIILALGVPTTSIAMTEIPKTSPHVDGNLTQNYNPEMDVDSTPVQMWSPLANYGLNFTVFALAIDGSELYAGGYFSKTGDGSLMDLGGIAHYDIESETWSALPNQGLNKDPRALAVVGDDLYIGGYFTATMDSSLTNLGYIVRYDTKTNTFHALPNQGLNSHVWTLEAVGTDLYVGGNFTQTGDGSITNLGRIARFDTVNQQWHALPNQGLNWFVLELQANGNDLYVGGLFTQTDDNSLKNLGHIIRYDLTTETWHAFPTMGLNDAVRAIEPVGNDLYIGGDFTETGDGFLKDLGCIVRYNIPTATWHALPNQGLDLYVSNLQNYGDDLYAGGWFTQTVDHTMTELGFVARYNKTSQTWNALPNQGLNGEVNALVVNGSNIFIGGYFSESGDSTVKQLGYIARISIYENSIFLPIVINNWGKP